MRVSVIVLYDNVNHWSNGVLFASITYQVSVNLNSKLDTESRFFLTAWNDYNRNQLFFLTECQARKLKVPVLFLLYILTRKWTCHFQDPKLMHKDYWNDLHFPSLSTAFSMLYVAVKITVLLHVHQYLFYVNSYHSKHISSHENSLQWFEFSYLWSRLDVIQIMSDV